MAECPCSTSPRTRHGRAAPGVRGARAGHPQPARAALTATPPSRRRRIRQHRRWHRPTAWPWPPPTWASPADHTWLARRLVAFDMPGTRAMPSWAFERDGQKFELIDTAACAARARCSSDREILGHQDPCSDADATSWCCCSTPPGRHRPGPHIAATSSTRAGAVCRDHKVDAVDSYHARCWIARSNPARVPEVRAGDQHSALKRTGLGPLWKNVADAHASAHRKMSTPGSRAC